MTTSADSQEQRSQLSKAKPLPAPRVKRILDFDIETVAAGFADPQWVPQKITCVAWSWIGEDEVHDRICGPTGLFGNPKLRAGMLRPLLAAMYLADIWTGHNILRFDLPVINAECMRLGLPLLPTRQVEDTMRVAKCKGFKKGQDNMARLLGTESEKMALDWQAWQDGYDEKNWKTIRERAITDVIGHKEMRLAVLDSEWLRAKTWWVSK